MKKENIFLTITISLPLLLIGYFVLKPLWLQNSLIPPQYDVLLSALSDSNNSPDEISGYSFRMKNKKLKLIAHRYKKLKNYFASSEVVLFRFDVKKQKLIPISFDVMTVKKKIGAYSWIVDIPEISTYTLSQNKKAPDGFLYKTQKHHSHSILFDLFQTAYPTYILQKEGTRFAIPIDTSRFRKIQFRGWILKNE